MRFAKRIVLFVLVNALVVVTLSLVAELFGIRPYLNAQGLDYGALLGFCLVWGFGGALISLGLSRIMAKFAMGVKVIDPHTNNSQDRDLVELVHRLAMDAGLPAMPEVGIYDSPEVNAFATGPTRSRSLVAVSSGLMANMNRDQVEGVLGHEIAHIANGDMVTMTLIQGVVNAFAMFFARIVGFFVSQFVKEDGPRAMIRFAVTMLSEFAFTLLGLIVVSAFSRHREFRADAGGAKFAGRQKMIGALQGLQRMYEPSMAAAAASGQKGNGAIAAFKISGKSRGFLKLFSTHPPLEERIRRLSEVS